MTATPVSMNYTFRTVSASDAYIAIREAGFGAGATSAHMIPGSKEMDFVFPAGTDVQRARETVDEALELWLMGRLVGASRVRGWAANVTAVWAD